MNRTLGAFFCVRDIDAQDAFSLNCWQWFKNLPSSLRPKRIGNYEPLKRVEDASIEQVLRDNYWVSNGRRLSGSVHLPCARDGLLSNITLILEVRKIEAMLCAELYDSLTQLGSPKFSYMAAVDDSLFDSDRALYKMLNTGLVEQDITHATKKSSQFISFELRA